MSYTSRLLAAASLSALALSSAALADPVFNRISSFAVNSNLSADEDQKTVTSVEIVTASEDGNTLVYSDSPARRIGFIDITDAANPKPAGFVKLDGEPTSVAVAGGKVLVAINTSKSKVEPSGTLLAVDIKDKSVAASCDLGGQPDSVAVAPDGSFAAIAIENERDEDLNDGVIPQMPAGYLSIVKLKDGVADCAAIIKVDLTGLAAVAGDDPEPEFVDINGNNEIAVTLQENNHVVIVGADGKVISHFPAGLVDLAGVDTKSEGAITFTGEKKGVPREPDTVQWIGNDRLLVANEGDYEGGSRGFTIFKRNGEVEFDSGMGFEYQAALAGHYPERRSRAKGVEPEGAEVKQFGADTFLFVLAERASVVGVYKDTDKGPQFMQLLPTGLSPEGAVAIPQRNLLAVSSEVDLVEDGGVRPHVMLYQLGEGTAAYPTILSSMDEKGVPIGWGALSGLTADPEKEGILYAVNDSFYSMQPSIFTIDANQKPARITEAKRILRSGQTAQLLDIEGIVADGKGGFWLASEGRSDTMVPHGILHVNDKGEIDQSIGLPPELAHAETRYGFEGITAVGSGDDLTLWLPVQREWADDEKGTVKLVSYKPKSKEWGAVRYTLDAAPEGGWVGLSEITLHGDFVYLIERDNQVGEKAQVKKLYRVALADLKPAKLGEALPVVNKELVRDLLPDLKSTAGYVIEKVEGFTVDKAGNGYVVTDNDGVNDSNGETLFWSIGKL
ncbi:MAG: esterase-like activity of phytase family protein [Proteobacteria bacterium]|nr:esterase-like activity of phytase family protein [Pseudomonadota bacterium]